MSADSFLSSRPTTPRRLNPIATAPALPPPTHDSDSVSIASLARRIASLETESRACRRSLARLEAWQGEHASQEGRSRSGPEMPPCRCCHRDHDGDDGDDGDEGDGLESRLDALEHIVGEMARQSLAGPAGPTPAGQQSRPGYDPSRLVHLLHRLNELEDLGAPALAITVYADGYFLGSPVSAFHEMGSPEALAFEIDLVDSFTPWCLSAVFPDGCRFEVKDERGVRFGGAWRAGSGRRKAGSGRRRGAGAAGRDGVRVQTIHTLVSAVRGGDARKEIETTDDTPTNEMKMSVKTWSQPEDGAPNPVHVDLRPSPSPLPPASDTTATARVLVKASNLTCEIVADANSTVGDLKAALVARNSSLDGKTFLLRPPLGAPALRNEATLEEAGCVPGIVVHLVQM
ncbi:hypothetical protein HDU93_001632 [Gonapodya sp. JEL0774]|nr:hypothetical protein HDU93_001632 [Gonapodya sp. JEL0774]